MSAVYAFIIAVFVYKDMSLADVPRAVAQYLAAQGLGSQAVAWPALRDHAWADAGLQIAFRAPRRDGVQGVSPDSAAYPAAIASGFPESVPA